MTFWAVLSFGAWRSAGSQCKRPVASSCPLVSCSRSKTSGWTCEHRGSSVLTSSLEFGLEATYCRTGWQSPPHHAWWTGAYGLILSYLCVGPTCATGTGCSRTWSRQQAWSSERMMCACAASSLKDSIKINLLLFSAPFYRFQQEALLCLTICSIA